MTGIEKENCCGCGACAAKCRFGAFKMQRDQEGFWYPEFRKEYCTECGQCEQVCPVLHMKKCSGSKKTFSVFAEDREELRRSSSGGAARGIARQMLAKGGVVWGVEYSEDFSCARYCKCGTKEELDRIVGSKYVAARKETLYQDILQELEAGKKVLMIGLPCEIAALKAYLGKEERLYTCALICRAPASELVLERYIDELESSYGERVIDVNMRDKTFGWAKPCMKIRFEDGRTHLERLEQTDFWYGFAKLVRPYCYHCGFKGEQIDADLIIGDHWGSEETKENTGMGVSLVISNSEKGVELITEMEGFRIQEVNYDDIRKSNPALFLSETRDMKRDFFAGKLKKGGLAYACRETKGFRGKTYYMIKKCKHYLRSLKSDT